MKKEKYATFYEIIGWYGMSALIIAYGLTSFGIISGTGTIYQLLNLTGALGLMLIAYHKKVWQSVTLNIFWMIIGIIALINIII